MTVPYGELISGSCEAGAAREQQGCDGCKPCQPWGYALEQLHCSSHASHGQENWCGAVQHYCADTEYTLVASRAVADREPIGLCSVQHHLELAGATPAQHAA